MDKQLTVGSLFSGIGGLDLGLERAGMRVIWQSEIDPYASRVLNKHWPEVPNYGDIKKICWEDVPPTDVICGGYPCQPFSVAGQRKGENDERHLWPWVRHAISNLRPRYVILENVQGHLSLGGTTVVREITELGYMCEWRVISAASVGARHRRNRLFIVAYPASKFGDGRRTSEREEEARRRETLQTETRRGGSNEVMADSRSLGRFGRGGAFEGLNAEIKGYAVRSAAYWTTEPDVGRVANGVPSRVDRLKGLGNAVVPQVAEIIGRLVIEHANNA